jgi:hypothetical protein
MIVGAFAMLVDDLGDLGTRQSGTAMAVTCVSCSGGGNK